MKSVYATPKCCMELSVTDGTGVLVEVTLLPYQIWRVSSRKSYKVLSRRSSKGFTLRLTESAFRKYFDIMETDEYD